MSYGRVCRRLGGFLVVCLDSSSHIRLCDTPASATCRGLLPAAGPPPRQTSHCRAAAPRSDGHTAPARSSGSMHCISIATPAPAVSRPSRLSATIAARPRIDAPPTATAGRADDGLLDCVVVGGGISGLVTAQVLVHQLCDRASFCVISQGAAAITVAPQAMPRRRDHAHLPGYGRGQVPQCTDGSCGPLRWCSLLRNRSPLLLLHHVHTTAVSADSIRVFVDSSLIAVATMAKAASFCSISVMGLGVFEPSMHSAQLAHATAGAGGRAPRR